MRYRQLILPAVFCCLSMGTAAQQAATPMTRMVIRNVFVGDTTDYYGSKLRPEGGDTTLAEFLLSRIKSRQLTAYTSTDNFTVPMTVVQVSHIFGRADTVDVIDPVSNITVTKVEKTDFKFDDVRYYNVLEEWKYNIDRGATDVQIVAIAPMRDTYLDEIYTDKDKGDVSARRRWPICWIKYADVKKHLAAYQSAHPNTNLPLAVWNQFFTEKPNQ